MAFVSKIEKANFINYERDELYQIEAWGHPTKDSYYSLLAIYTPSEEHLHIYRFKILSSSEDYKLTGYHKDQIFMHEGIFPTRVVITKLT